MKGIKNNFDNPLVSICIPTYNGASFIAEAMASAIIQDYSNLEIIVSDDASSDDTLSIIESFKTQTKIPISIHHHEPNGIGANWNHCIAKAQGDYIKFLFQDDVLLPTCISTMVEVFRTHDSIAIVASKRDFIVETSFLDGDSSKWISTYGDLQQHLNLPVVDGVSFIDYSLFGRSDFFESPMNKIGEPTTFMFKKDLIAKVGWFREDLKQVLDYEFCYRVLTGSTIAIITKPLVRFRLHGSQTTVINKGTDAYASDYAIYEKLIFDNYYRFLSSNTKKRLLRKYNFFAGKFYDIADVVKRLILKPN